MRRLLGIPALFLLVLLVALVAGLPSGYYVITPGGTYDIEARLRIPDEWRRAMGRLAFTAVYARDGAWGDLVGAWLSGTARVVPVDEVRPPGVSQAELNELNRRLMEESEAVAAVVALRAAGLDARVTGQGAEVVAVVDGMPAAGVLRVGDVIVSVDGRPARTAVEVVEATRKHRVGEPIRLGILRDGHRREVVVGTRQSDREPSVPVMGAAISTRAFDVELPFPVEVVGDDVGGPSAGLMLALGILDGVTPGLLAEGYFVAGTGTIAADGTVGPIGGAAQKVVAAERDGVQVFLVPRENYQEARNFARAARIVPVERFADALGALCGLAPVEGASSEPPEPCADLAAKTTTNGSKHE